jgi:hypothetical protein
MTRKSANKVKCAIGRPVLGVTVKLSDGDFGELLVKKAVMFTRYEVTLSTQDSSSTHYSQVHRW